MNSTCRPRNRRRLAAVAALSVAALVAGASAAPAASVRAIDNYRQGGNPLSGPGRDAPGLAVHPADPSHLVSVHAEVLSRNCEHRVSRDGGRTWTGGSLRAPAGFPAQPCTGDDSSGNMDAGVAFGTGQQVYTAFTSPRDGQDVALVARSQDGGDSFEVGVPALSSPATGLATTGFARYPKIAVERRVEGDRIYLAGTTALLTRSDDGGRTWSRPLIANTPGSTAAEATQPAVDAEGVVYLAWRTNNPQGGNTIVLARSEDLGASWTRSNVASVPSGGSNFPRLAVDPTSEAVYVVYGRNPPPPEAPASAPTPGISARDHFIPKDADVMVASSADGGRTFEAPVRVNDDLVGNGVAQRHPNISVSRTGRLDVVWHDRRHALEAPTDAHRGNGDARLGDTYMSFSTDGGRSFAANRRVTDRSINNDLGLDYKCCSYWTYGPVSVPIGDDQLLVSWSDTREGDVDTESQQIYLAPVDLNAAASLPVRRVEAAGDALAAAASTLAYPAGAEAVLADGGFANSPRTEVVIVDPADEGLALAATVLARGRLGTVLPSGPDGLSPEVRAEVRRLGPVGAVLLGDEAAVPTQVAEQLAADGVPADRTSRIAGKTAPETAALVARALVPADEEPAFDAAVVINPESAESGAAAALAATFRYPVLLVGRDTVPADTKKALADFGAAETFLIGDEQAISPAVAAQVPSPRRLSGDGAAGTSEATLQEALRRGAPSNIVYVADAARPFEAALLAPAVARAGGLMLLTSGADAEAAEQTLSRLGLRDRVDRLVVLRVAASSAAPPAAVSPPRSAPPAGSAQTGASLPATGSGGAPLAAVLAVGIALLFRRALRSPGSY